MANQVHIISPRRRDAIIDDLLKLHPTGPRGNLVKDDYKRGHQWSSTRSGYVNMTTPLRDGRAWPHYGYDVETLQRVWHETDQGNYRSYLRTRWGSDIGSKAVSRRENRLRDRLQPAHDAFIRQNTRGIWECRAAYGLRLFVMAGSSETAILLTKTMLAGCGFKVDDYVRANLVNVPDPKLLAHYNNKNMERVASSLKRSIKTIEDEKQNVSTYKEMITALEDFGAIQPEMLGVSSA